MKTKTMKPKTTKAADEDLVTACWVQEIDVSGLDLEELELAALAKIPEDATEEEADAAYSTALRKLIAKKRRTS